VFTGGTIATTVAAGTDNQQISFTHSTGAVADTYTLGNGSNYVLDQSTGVVSVTTGTGLSTVSLNGALTGIDTITVGSHTSTATTTQQIAALSNTATNDFFTVGSGSATAISATVGYTVITGTSAFDQVAYATAGSATTATTIAAGTDTLTAFIAKAVATANTVTLEVIGGTTYVYDHAAGAAYATGDVLVGLVGTHTIGSITSTGFTITA
jgi:hypothetical protein